MSTPTVMGLDVYRGDTGRWTAELFSDPDATVPYDLSGVTVAAQIRARPRTQLLAELDCAVTLPNVIDFTLTPAASSRLRGSNARWDVRLTFPSGDVVTAIAGPVTITGAITT